jgi:DNA replication and repair protein RecF
MIFTDLRLQHYRSYQDSSFELGKGVNIVVGPNAAGKTNLLEAVMVASVGKSYRARDVVSLIRKGAGWARIDLHTSENVLRTVKLKIDQSGKLQKTFEIDKKVFKRLPLAQRQPTILFEPNDLQLVESEPSLRRNYFDDIIEQYTPGYEKNRAQYKRVIAQRNALLKQGGSIDSQIFAWNLRLVDLGEKLVTERLQLLEQINKKLPQTYSAIAGSKTTVKIEYESAIGLDGYSTKLLKKLESSQGLDIQRGFTGNGPHRDEFMIYIKGQPALQSASRGEIRTLLLALKIIELKILENERGVRPLLLLDDVFSELDGSRRRALTEFLKDYQTIITTTDADAVIQNFSQDTAIIPIA